MAPVAMVVGVAGLARGALEALAETGAAGEAVGAGAGAGSRWRWEPSKAWGS